MWIMDQQTLNLLYILVLFSITAGILGNPRLGRWRSHLETRKEQCQIRLDVMRGLGIGS